MMLCGFKTDSRRNLSLFKRDIYGISSREMINIRQLYQAMFIVISGRSILQCNHRMTKHRRKMIRLMLCGLYCGFLSQLYFEHLMPPRPPILQRPTSVNDFGRENFSGKFRFHKPEDLERVMIGLKFPTVIKVHGYRYTRGIWASVCTPS